MVPHKGEQNVLRRIRCSHIRAIRLGKACIFRQTKQECAKVAADLAGRHVVLRTMRGDKRKKVHHRVEEPCDALFQPPRQHHIGQCREAIGAFLRTPARVRHPWDKATLLLQHKCLVLSPLRHHTAYAGKDPLQQRHETVHTRKLELLMECAVRLRAGRAQRIDDGSDQPLGIGCREVHCHRA